MDLKAVKLATGGKAEKNRQIVVCVKNVGAKPLLCPDMVRLIGIEPTHPAPEAGALSTELQAHTLRCDHYYSIVFLKRKEVFFKNSSAEKAGKKRGEKEEGEKKVQKGKKGLDSRKEI